LVLKNYFLAFVPIFVAVDVLGMLPIFMSLTHAISKTQKEKLIRQSTMTALLVAISFLMVGKLILLWLGVTISDFLVAGGAILFIISIRDLLSYGKAARIPDETAGVVPLAVPLIVGPAVLTTSLILLNSFGIFPTLFSLVANILLCGVILHFSMTLSKVLGKTGSHTLSKISSLLLAAIGVMLIRRGVLEIISAWLSR
jgi:multiple antibiotic resistance protein